MSHSFHQLYYHIVWATKERMPYIVPETKQWLIDKIVEKAMDRGAWVLACNAMPDHIH